jgi:acyl carrier protein
MDQNYRDHLRTIVESAVGQRAMPRDWTAKTLLLGEVAELDSMALLAILTQIEEDFEVKIDDSEISAEIFESVGSLEVFVSGKLEN